MNFVTPYIALRVLRCFLPVRDSRWAKLALYAGFYIFISTSVLVGDPINILGAILAICITVSVCCSGTFLQRITVVLVFSSFSLSINSLIDTYLRYNIELNIRTDFTIQFYGILRAIIWLAVYFSLRHFKPEAGYRLPPKLWLLVDMLTLAPFATTFITVTMNGYVTGRNKSLSTFLLLIIAAFTSYGLLWEVSILAHNQKLQQEENFYEMNRMYYKNLEQEQLKVRKLRHDMANHLQAMSAMPESELHAYLNELMSSPAMEHSKKYCENNVVNIVLSSKAAIMEQKSITFETSAAVPENIPVKDAELCAVVANSLDNAVEACEKLPKLERHVSVKAAAQKGLFVLNVKNPEGAHSILENGLPVTTKGDTASHGLGLAGIKDIAERYGGGIEISENGRTFSLLVYMHIT
jgi:sensor histidine kinase YesM